jgi:hypothetical protein
MFLKSGFYDISDEFVRNEKEYESGMLCKNCYSRNKRLLRLANVAFAEVFVACTISMKASLSLWSLVTYATVTTIAW